MTSRENEALERTLAKALPSRSQASHQGEEGLVSLAVLRETLRDVIREELRGTRTVAEWLTAREAAEVLGIHEKTVGRYVRENRLPATRVGTSYRFRREDLEAFLEQNRSAR